MIVSFVEYDLVPRFDGVPWTKIKIEESDSSTGPFVVIDLLTIDPLDENPADPQERSFTTELATINNGWYRISFVDEAGNTIQTEPVYNKSLITEIMASLEDINAELDGEVIEANSDNTALVQINVSRMIRGYLSRVVSTVTMATWDNPEDTPDILRVCAAKFIAAQVYFNYAARTSLTIDQDSFAQKRYDEAMAILQGIIDGLILLEDPGTEPIVPADLIGALDFHPQDATDRAFTVGMEL
jgi:hypothetical protein